MWVFGSSPREMSSINSTKSKGPKIDPCGTPDTTGKNGVTVLTYIGPLCYSTELQWTPCVTILSGMGPLVL